MSDPAEAGAQPPTPPELRFMLEHANEGLCLLDANGRFVYVNARMSELTGYDAVTLLGMRGEDLLDTSALPPGYTPGERLRREGRSTTQLVLRRRDGSRFDADISATLLPDGRSMGIVRDVSEPARVMRQLREALALVNATLESTADGILVVDETGRMMGHNRRFGEMWNIPDDVLATRDDSAALACVQRQLRDPEVFTAKVRELYDSPEAESFDTLEFLDGRVFERFSLPHRVDGRTRGRVWSFRDVTAARRQAEALRESEARLQQAQKLEAIGRLAGGLAHDFNNMLTAILGESEQLLQRLPADSRDHAHAENIRAAAQRSAGLTRQLLAIGRRQPVQPRAFDLADVLFALDPLIRQLLGPGVVLRFERPEVSPWVFADPAQLEQALVNLAINAHDAMPAGGMLAIRVGSDTLSHDDARRRGARHIGAHAWFEVRDTGTGIPAEVRPHLFEPFFTTKSQGTGLGLASVYGMVEQCEGFIEVCSELGEGATFRIHLPEIAAPGASAPSPPEASEHPAARGTVLLADDESAVRSFVAAVLRQMGYAVIEAGSGDEALALARAHHGAIELLVTDVVMPGRHGWEAARELQRERPELRVLLMSGYPDLDAGRQGYPVLAKPFGSQALGDAIRNVLKPRDGVPRA